MPAKLTLSDVEREFKIAMPRLEARVRNAYLDYLAEQSHPSAEIERFKKLKNAPAGIKRAILRMLKQRRAAVHKLICKDLNYCARIEAQSTKFALEFANAIVTGKIALLTALPIPAVKIAVYVVRTRLLDPFCECKQSS